MQEVEGVFGGNSDKDPGGSMVVQQEEVVCSTLAGEEVLYTGPAEVCIVAEQVDIGVEGVGDVDIEVVGEVDIGVVGEVDIGVVGEVDIGVEGEVDTGVEGVGKVEIEVEVAEGVQWPVPDS